MHRSDVQLDSSQGRRGRDTGSYVDRGERSEAPPGRRRYMPDSWRRAPVPCLLSSFAVGVVQVCASDFVELIRAERDAESRSNSPPAADQAWSDRYRCFIRCRHDHPARGETTIVAS